MKLRIRNYAVAETITFLISTFLILALIAFLIRDWASEVPKLVTIKVQPRMDEIAQVNGKYILPVEVSNANGRSVSRLVLSVRTADDPSARREIEIQYLGRGAMQTVYIYFEKNPAAFSIDIQPSHYLLD